MQSDRMQIGPFPSQAYLDGFKVTMGACLYPQSSPWAVPNTCPIGESF